ncbi:metallophosphoesterase [Nocardioides sp. NPDC127503]|uniref:metallophosphoesterase n=1 Tax=Nocardioides sp. NPDC127503 TaxID=3154516 RepID=UPI003322AE16
MRLASVIGATLGTGLATGAAMTAYALWEARQYTLRHVGLPVLPEGADPLRVLHLSDMHVVPSQHKKLDWIASLATLKPDLVIDTGDNLAHQRAVPSIVNALGGLLDVPGVFVHGSNDYYEPRMRNPIGYLLPDNGKRQTNVPELPWRDLSASFTKSGWLDLTNTRSSLTVKGIEFAFAGVDDPHLRLDDLSSVAGPADPAADVRLGVAHAPYLRVLDQFTADGYDAILAGHTHGGQICLPGGRALATNCDLDPARVRGLHTHTHGGRQAWLHVSAGLGTSPYTRIRIACRPEATLLTLTPRGASRGASRR